MADELRGTDAGQGPGAARDAGAARRGEESLVVVPHGRAGRARALAPRDRRAARRGCRRGLLLGRRDPLGGLQPRRAAGAARSAGPPAPGRTTSPRSPAARTSRPRTAWSPRRWDAGTPSSKRNDSDPDLIAEQARRSRRAHPRSSTCATAARYMAPDGSAKVYLFVPRAARACVINLVLLGRAVAIARADDLRPRRSCTCRCDDGDRSSTAPRLGADRHGDAVLGAALIVAATCCCSCARTRTTRIAPRPRRSGATRLIFAAAAVSRSSLLALPELVGYCVDGGRAARCRGQRPRRDRRPGDGRERGSFAAADRRHPGLQLRAPAVGAPVTGDGQARAAAGSSKLGRGRAPRSSYLGAAAIAGPLLVLVDRRAGARAWALASSSDDGADWYGLYVTAGPFGLFWPPVLWSPT